MELFCFCLISSLCELSGKGSRERGKSVIRRFHTLIFATSVVGMECLLPLPHTCLLLANSRVCYTRLTAPTVCYSDDGRCCNGPKTRKKLTTRAS